MREMYSMEGRLTLNLIGGITLDATGMTGYDLQIDLTPILLLEGLHQEMMSMDRN